MTKKFFKDWSNKQSLTKSIYLFDVYSFEEKDKSFYCREHDLYINTLKFSDDYIQINARLFYLALDFSQCGYKIMPIKIHRKDIKTVKFKKIT
jgi:hypothetical protein